MKKSESIELLVFSDESNLDSSTLMICSLAISIQQFERILKSVIRKFGDIRRIPEIHYNEIDRGPKLKRDVAHFLISHIASLHKNDGVFINITIANKSHLDVQLRKRSDRDAYAEKVFTRLAITYTINQFTYRYKKVRVQDIVIDKGGKTDDTFFRDYAIRKISTRSRAALPKEITFVDSDPRKEAAYPEYSLFVDIVDIILGTCNNCCRVKKAANKEKKKITERIFNDILLRFHRGKKCIGKINTHPKLKRIVRIREKSLSGSIHVRIRPKYSENQELIKKFSPKPYTVIPMWRSPGREQELLKNQAHQ